MAQGELYYRHRLSTRIAHWINAVAIFVLLLSGLQIFNAHPALYWGRDGFMPSAAPFEIGAQAGEGFVRFGDTRFGTTGVLGLSEGLNGTPEIRAFPTWATLPAARHLSEGRRWHFFFAWVLVINGIVALAIALANRHIARDLVPTRADLRPGNIWHDVKQHALLRFPKGESAKMYHVLQKISYFTVALVLLPLVVATGITMSPGMNAAWGGLVDIFGGRQSARTIHFIAAALITLFIIVHIVMVVLAGPVNQMRAIVTGRMRVQHA